MKSHLNGTIVAKAPLHPHRARVRFPAHSYLSPTSLPNKTCRHLDKTKPSTRHERAVKLEKQNALANTLWVIKIGNSIIGNARLVQDGPDSARIVQFRIDPEWSHTKIPLNLINSIQSFCSAHGPLKVTLPPHVVPSWIQTLMSRHGFQRV
jgi:hypothetical protein